MTGLPALTLLEEIMCVRKTGTVRASFDIHADDLARVLITARNQGIDSGALYRRAVAEYLVNHDAGADGWPVGDAVHRTVQTVEQRNEYGEGWAES